MKSFLGGALGAVAVAVVVLFAQSGAFTFNQSRLAAAPAAPAALLDANIETAPVLVPVARAATPRYVRYAAADRVVDPGYDSQAERRSEVKKTRSWKKSAVIIGGSTAGGAGLGAILGGGRGAKKGAVVGGVAGVVYDIATRNK
jgi:hypothetical protein